MIQLRFYPAFWLLLLAPNLLFGENQLRPVVTVSFASQAAVITQFPSNRLPASIYVRVTDPNGLLLALGRYTQLGARRKFNLALPEVETFRILVSYRARAKGRLRKLGSFSVDVSANDSTSGSTPPRNLPQSTAPKSCPPELVSRAFELVNQERVLLGLPALIDNDFLRNAAEIHSDRMATFQTLTHDSWYQEIRESGFQGSTSAQNIATYIRDPAELVAGWMQSPGHRTQILRVAFLYAGLACSSDESGVFWWTQNFGGGLL